MKFADVYARLGPDVIAIAEALGITEPEADTLINEHMDRRHLQREAEYIKAVRKPEPQKRGLVRYSGYDRKEAMGVNGGRYD